MEYAKLSEGERWAGVYFSLITDVSLESFVPNLEGMGDILLCSREMAALGNTLKEIEESYAFLNGDLVEAAASEGGAK